MKGISKVDPQTLREVASDIILISIGLLAATLIMVGPTWNRFLTCWEQTSSEGRRMIFKSFVTAFGLAIFVLAPTTIALWVNPYGWFYELPYIYFILGIVVIIVLVPIAVFLVLKWVLDRLRNRSKEKQQENPDFSKEIGVSSAITFFILTIFVLTFTMLSAIDIAIGISLDVGTQQENFEFARAMVSTIPAFFIGGLLFLGMSYIADIKKRSELDSVDE